jgi:hypothetical protein
VADNSKRNDASAQFKKDQRAEDGRKAMADYEAEAAAIRAKTEKLRALRLAREAEIAKNAPVKPAKPVKSVAKTSGKTVTGKAPATKKKTAKPGKNSSTLAEWLKGRQEDGF